MNTVDFSQDNIILKLVNPIFYIDPKKREQIIIDEVEISRLNTPQLNTFKTRMSQLSSKLGTLSFMIPFFHNLCKVGIVRAYSEKMPITPFDKDIIDMLPFESAYKVGMYILMHLRETSYVVSSYKCEHCEATNLFDIDPDAPMSDSPEPGRSYQLDYLYYCNEIYNTENKQYFTYTLTKPVVIEVPKDPKAAQIEWEKAEVSFFKFQYPTVKMYSDIASNPDRAASGDYYALYEALVEVSDFDRQTTHKIKLKNTINKIFNFKNKEFIKMLEVYQEFKFLNEFSYDCLHCGQKNETVFDITNFFESLKS